MAFELEVSRVDESYPEALQRELDTEVASGRGVPGWLAEEVDTRLDRDSREGRSGGNRRCVTVPNESEAP